MRAAAASQYFTPHRGPPRPMKFSKEQLAILQAALAPTPPMVTPPHMNPVPQPQTHAVPPVFPPQPPAGPSQSTLEVSALAPTVALLLVASLLAAVDLVQPAWLVPAALISSPLAIAGFALYSAGAQWAGTKALGVLLAAAYPLVCLHGRAWGAWGYCLALSVFLSLLAQGHPGLIPRVLWAGVVVIACEGALLSAGAPAKVTWGPIVTVLCLQCIVGAAHTGQGLLRMGHAKA